MLALLPLHPKEVTVLQRIFPALFISLLVVLLVAGCGGGSGSGSNTPVTATLVPLATGNEWHYQYNEYTQPAAVRARGAMIRHHSGLTLASKVQLKDLAAEDVVQITGTQQIGGAPWFSVVAQYVGGDPAAAVYLRHTAQGLQRKDALTDPAFFMIKTPLAVGTTWTVFFVDSGLTYHEDFSITASSQSVSVPAGVYNDCVVIENVFQQAGQPDDVITYWYAPGVGEVREERHLGTFLLYELQLLAAPTLVQ